MRDSSTFGLAVIGAGPAGAATAITAARFGVKVALLEAGQFPRHKVCGEFVSAESLHILHDLLHEIPDAKQALAAAPVIGQTCLWFRGRTIRATLEPPGLSLPRFDLDYFLWCAAENAGVCGFENCDVRSIEGDGPFHTATNRGALTAAAVVIAAGRWSKFTPNGAVPPRPKWLGIKAHFHESQPPLSTDLYFFEGGYCGLQPVGENLVNACAMVRSDFATTLPEVFALDAALADRARSWQPATNPVTTAPLIYRPPSPTSANRILVGDAAAFIDPFVGDGISIALRTGTLAANRLQAVLQGSTALNDAVESYRTGYYKQFTAPIRAASQIRKLLFWPRPMQIALFELLRTPGVLPHLIRKTRRAESTV